MLSKQQREYFKNSKIRNEDGSLMVVYHGSPNTFTEFSKDYIGINGTSCGSGFNFTPDKEYAEMLATGENAMLVEAYVNITNPLSCDKFTLTKNDIEETVYTLVNKCNKYVECIEDDSIEGLTAKLFKYYDNNEGTVWASDAALLDEILDEFMTMISGDDNLLSEFEGNTDLEEFYNEETEEYEYDIYDVFKSTLRDEIHNYIYGELGYDGYVGHSFNGSEVVVCIEPNQIKAIDNLYPNKGNNFVGADTNQFLFGDCEFLACEINKKYGYQIEAVIDSPDYMPGEYGTDLTEEEFLKLSYEERRELFQKYLAEGSPSASVVHCYNTFEENGTKYYVDARGITSDKNEFFLPYGQWVEDSITMTFKNEQDIRNRFFSTYYDWYGEKDLDKITEKRRIKPAKEYIKNNPELFERKTITKNMSLEERLKVAASMKSNKSNKETKSKDLEK